MAFKLPNWIWSLIISVLGPLVGLLTPQIKSALVDFINDLYERAKKTDNPVDDVVVKLLAAILEINLPE